jgi:hypothetical protein
MQRLILLSATLVVLATGAAFWLLDAEEGNRSRDLGLVAVPVVAAVNAETSVSLKSLAEAGPIVTVVGEINYDAAQLRMKECRTDGERAGKTLHIKEPVPGTVRAVLAGSLDPLPPSSEVMTCTFEVTGRSGQTVVRAHGEVADTTFVDRPFALEQTVRIGS